jgi:general stress protein 26
LTPVWYLFENELFYFECSSTSRKARNIAHRPRVTIMIDVRRPGASLWVSASGPAELIKGEKSKEINSRIQQRYLTKEALEDPRVGPVFAASDDVTICLRPEKWHYWNAKQVDDRIFGGILGSTPDRWYLPLDS